MRGSLIVGNDRHHPDGWHVGQTFGLKDRRLPNQLNNRRWVIQKVNVSLIPGQNWRVYAIEFGDAPVARSSSRHAPAAATVQKPPLPGRLWDIAYRQFSPLPDSVTTVVGQLISDANEPRRVPGVIVKLEVLTWDATDTPVIPTEGTLSADSATTDIMGQWQVDMTAGPGAGYSYKGPAEGASDPMSAPPFHLSRGPRIRTPMAGGGGAPFVINDYCREWPVSVPHEGGRFAWTCTVVYTDAMIGSGTGLIWRVKIDGEGNGGATMPNGIVALAPFPSHGTMSFSNFSPVYAAGPHDFSFEWSSDDGATWDVTGVTMLIWDLPDDRAFVADCT